MLKINLSGHNNKVKLSRHKKFVRVVRICSFILFFSSMIMFAANSYTILNAAIHQQITITGTVSDVNGEPLPGVTVIIKGTTQGTATDASGAYSLQVTNENAILVFSYIGFISQETTIGARRSINITLSEESRELGEVVVVGYGVQRKISLTNAISSIGSNDLLERNSTNVYQALQGKLPGLTIIDRGGAPGAEGLTLRIRGVTSLNANDPLVLIDGIPGSLSQVNPIDIESVSLLKDAASAAIYGSRAAAGVILVTTKTPKEGRLSVTYDGYFGIARTNNNPVHMDAMTYMIQQNVASINTYGTKIYEDDYLQQWPANHAKDPEMYPLPNTWQDAMYSLAPQHSHTLTINGGNEKNINRISVRFMNQEGVLPNYGFNISEFRSRNEFKVNRKLTLSSNINARFTERKAPINEWESYYRMWQNSQWGVPVYKDGSYGLSVDSYSPLISAKEWGLRTNSETYLMGIFKGDFQIFDALKFSAQYSTQYWFQNHVIFNNTYDFSDKLFPARRTFNTINSMTDWRNKSTEDGADLQLVYNKTFAKHTIAGILGYSQIHYVSDNVQGYRRNFYNNELQTMSQGANDATQQATGGASEWGLRSYFSRINYEYDGKYLLEVNARYDGSSRFAKGKQYGFFPSVSAGWILSGESFWGSLSNAINHFKLRGSWGSVGSQQVGLFSFMRTYGLSNYIFNESLANGYRVTSLADENISWETTTQLDVGLDAYLLNNKINVSFDYYNKRTNDILLVVPIPSIMGLSATNQNAGIVDNKGFELLLGGRQPFGDFNVDLTFAVNYNQNEVIDLAGTGPYVSVSSDAGNITAEGSPINAYYGYAIDGYFQTWDEVNNYAKWDGTVGPGDIKYVDQNNDGMLTPADYIVLGKEFPDWTFSSNMAVGWKNLRLDLFWQGVSGSQKALTGAVVQQGIWGGFTHKIFSDYWTPENPNAKYPRPTKMTLKNDVQSEFKILDGSYLRLKNIRLSYDIPKSFCSRLNISGINVYVSATNLLTFSKLNRYNIDPEMDGRNQESNFPQTSVTTLGLNINF